LEEAVVLLVRQRSGRVEGGGCRDTEECSITFFFVDLAFVLSLLRERNEKYIYMKWREWKEGTAYIIHFFDLSVFFAIKRLPKRLSFSESSHPMLSLK